MELLERWLSSLTSVLAPERAVSVRGGASETGTGCETATGAGGSSRYLRSAWEVGEEYGPGRSPESESGEPSMTNWERSPPPPSGVRLPR